MAVSKASGCVQFQQVLPVYQGKDLPIPLTLHPRGPELLWAMECVVRRRKWYPFVEGGEDSIVSCLVKKKKTGALQCYFGLYLKK